MKENVRSIQNAVRRALLWAASNAGLYAFMAFLYAGVLSMGLLSYYHLEPVEMIGRYVIVPWGMALCLLRLYKAAQNGKQASAEILPLALLLLWQIVPFALRFGLSARNMGCWGWYAAVYFGVYALTSEESKARREAMLDTLCGATVLFSLAYAGLALYAAYTVQAFWEIPGSVYGFGICDGMFLRCGVHYNISGMVAVCGSMICLCAAERFRKMPLRVAAALASVLMMAVVVLTQSRTARYVLIGALAVGAYALVRDSGKRSLARHAAGALAGVLVLAAAYVGMSVFSNAALSHYEYVRIVRAGITAQPGQEAKPEQEAEPEQEAKPEQEAGHEREAEPELGMQGEQGAQEMPEGIEADTAEAPEPEAVPTLTPEPLEAREAVDSSFSGRTGIWRNLFALWKSDPWHLLIGNGVGRTGGMVVEGTVNEGYTEISLHNAYLQFIADFGLIGFALKVLFFLWIVRPVLRVFLSPRAARRGEMPLCMLAAACLMTGLMESAPLSWGTPMNVMLYFVLGVLASKGRQLAKEPM